MQICIPDNHRKSTAQYRERLYKEAGEFRKKEKEEDMHLKQQERGKSIQGGRSRQPRQPERSQAPQPAQAAGQIRPDGPTAARRPADQPRDTLREMARAMGLWRRRQKASYPTRRSLCGRVDSRFQSSTRQPPHWCAIVRVCPQVQPACYSD